MPTGLKETSSLISISFQSNESGPNTFTQDRVDLQLNPLDQEVFVVYAINLLLPHLKPRLQTLEFQTALQTQTVRFKHSLRVAAVLFYSLHLVKHLQQLWNTLESLQLTISLFNVKVLETLLHGVFQAVCMAFAPRHRLQFMRP